jgi:double-stranded uracil-DNA glycosylase
MAGRIFSLEPVVDSRVRVLVLGSMPGSISLARSEYYAHPRNRFWPLMESLARIPAALPYQERLILLNAAGIGLWDVLYSCERSGSLDSGIDRSTERCNDIGGLLRVHEQIQLVCCNGGRSFRSFKTLMEPRLDDASRERVRMIQMPSTSPANASYGMDRLLESWSILVPIVLEAGKAQSRVALNGVSVT